MHKFVIEGPCQLNGTVEVSGAKNAVLPLMFATLLADGEHIFENVPHLQDVNSAAALLESLGSKVKLENGRMSITTTSALLQKADYDLVRKMRASILCLGPLLARYGSAEVSLPGGCAIGSRPIDLHLEALQQMGAKIEIESGYVVAKAKRLKGERILFDKVTVGGTENILMAACFADGVTVLENAAKEPEVVDLGNYLIKMGAKISGLGTSVITIQGSSEPLRPSTHRVIPDRIEAGTLIIAAAMTGGHVVVRDLVSADLEALLNKMVEAGVQIKRTETTVEVMPTQKFEAVDISTAPHPLFPTDLQAQFMSLMTQAHGTSVVSESVFENRFMHVQELMRLGADITPKPTVAVVRGPKKLKGAPVMATDLRASASLVLAGLVAEGTTEVKRIYHLDRGYESLERKLNKLGAKVTRMNE